MPRVTVVPPDRLIIVNGEALQFDYPAPPNLHALQWDGTAQSGHMEWTDDYNMALDASLYAEEVAPYVQLWEAEKARLVAEAEAKAPAVALAGAKAAKTAEIEAGYQRAVAATLTMPQASPTEQEIIAGAALFAVDDPEGLAYVMETARSTRAALLAEVEAAASTAEAEAVQVRYIV